MRSCHFTKEVKIFCENLELFGPYLAFLTKMSGNTSSITTKCKQTEEINILKITFDLTNFLIFPNFKILTFVVDRLGKKVNKFGLKKSKFVFYKYKIFCEGLKWNYRLSESNPRCFFSAFCVGRNR